MPSIASLKINALFLRRPLLALIEETFPELFGLSLPQGYSQFGTLLVLTPPLGLLARY